MFVQAPLQRGSGTARPEAVHFFPRGLFRLKHTERLLRVTLSGSSVGDLTLYGSLRSPHCRVDSSGA